MKKIVKTKPVRNLFGELREGMTALAESRQGKRTLRTHVVQYKPIPKVTPKELIRVRERLKCSRALFAGYLRTNFALWRIGSRAGQSRTRKPCY
jgi:DNA-binding transcriptional regulator YiaG